MSFLINPFFGGVPSDIYDIQTAIDITSLSINPNDVMWFKPYLASDFPEVTCDKTYFFIYSTDHAGGGIGGGEVWWGKGDNLDCSDFVEQGIIVTDYQAESPWLERVPAAECGDSEVIHLYYHTGASDPTNSGRQQTHLLTTTGGVLHTATWTQQGTILGGTEPHTGYFKPYKRGVSDYRGAHLITSGVPQKYSFSNATTGRNFTRSDEFKRTWFLPDFEQYKFVSGLIIQDKLGHNWWIGNTAPSDFVGNTKFCLIRLDSDFQPELFAQYLNGGVGITIVSNKLQGDLEGYVEGDICYLYWKDGTNIITGKYNLNNLSKYASLPDGEPFGADTISFYDFNYDVDDRFALNDGVKGASVTFVAGETVGQAGNFINTSTSYVRCTNATEFQASNIAVELDIKASATGTGLKAIVVKQLAFGIFADSGILKLYSWGAPTGFKVTTVDLNDGLWHTIKVEFRDGVTNGTKVWVDDVLELTTTYGFSAQTEQLVIGNGDDGSGTPSNQHITAVIDNVRIYSIT